MKSDNPCIDVFSRNHFTIHHVLNIISGSIPAGGNILSLDFFHVVKSLMPILALLPILSICEKLEWVNSSGSHASWNTVADLAAV